MSSVLDRAKAHLENTSARSISVPEWGVGNKALTVTWSPLTVAERRKIYEPADGKAPDGGLIMVRTLIRKARDENGRPLFDAMAEHDLLHKVDADVVGRISNAILFGAGLVDGEGKGVGIDEQMDASKKRLRADAELKIVFTLAYRLNRPVTEILDLPYDLFVTWLAFLKDVDDHRP